MQPKRKNNKSFCLKGKKNKNLKWHNSFSDKTLYQTAFLEIKTVYWKAFLEKYVEQAI